MKGWLSSLAVGVVLTGAGATEVRFAVIGDYGVDNADELAVADLVRTRLQPDFVVTGGDNNYLGADLIDRAIGKYYHDFIGYYTGDFGAGAISNRFFPALGNHDWFSGSGYSAHTNYFTLPGNERYYDLVRGPVHLFVLNSDPNEPDGTSATSQQALWFSNRIANATAPWRVVVAQDGPYSSTEPHAWMQWPFREWGAHIVISGDSHQYERIMRNGMPYVVNGAGGAPLAGFGTPTAGSTIRYSADHGAMLVTATEANIVFEFWSVANGGTLIDRFAQSTGVQLAIIRSNDLMRVSWPTNGSAGLRLQATTTVSPPAWTNVTASPVNVGERWDVTVPHSSTANAFFRLSDLP